MKGRLMKSGDSMAKTGAGGILLIGDIGTVFSDPDIADTLPCRICGNILDGIDAAARDPFSTVAVVLEGGAADFKDALKALRAGGDARIILLSRMYTEPQARRLVGNGDGGRFADDYLIYPMPTQEFCEALAWPKRGVEAGKVPADAGGRVKERVRRLEKLATEDDLTGLKNRRYIWEFARQIIERANRSGGRVTLLFFDIDNFKHYNDVYGHSAGDEVLKEAAVMMRRCCRRHDIVGRVGGDEFAVVFWDDPKRRSGGSADERRTSADHPSEVISIARRFRKELCTAELRLLGPEGKGTLTISGGLASLNRDGSTIEELFARADEALLEAKRNGKNRIYLVGGPENDIDRIQ